MKSTLLASLAVAFTCGILLATPSSALAQRGPSERGIVGPFDDYVIGYDLVFPYTDDQAIKDAEDELKQWKTDHPDCLVDTKTQTYKCSRYLHQGVYKRQCRIDFQYYVKTRGETPFDE